MYPVLATIPVSSIAQNWYLFVIPSIIVLGIFVLLTQWLRKKIQQKETVWNQENPEMNYKIERKDRLVFYVFSFFTYASVLLLVISLLSIAVTSSSATGRMDLPIRTYGVLLALGFITGIGLLIYRARKENLNINKLVNMFIWIVIMAILGARFFYMVWEDPLVFWDDPGLWIGSFFSLWNGGMAAYGGIIFASIAGIIYLYVYKLPVGKIVDIAAPSIAIGIMFARFGCLMNGCCFGNVIPEGACCHSFPVGIDLNSYAYPEAGSAGGGRAAIFYESASGYTPQVTVDGNTMTYDEVISQGILGVSVYATQFWSAINGLIAFIIFSLLYRIRDKLAFSGQLFLFFGMYYAATRATIELFRNDTERWFNLTAAQWIGVFIFITMLIAMIILWIRSNRMKNSPVAKEHIPDNQGDIPTNFQENTQAEDTDSTIDSTFRNENQDKKEPDAK